jgi:hypothetical protein
LGFSSSEADACLYSKIDKNQKLFLLLYVDDFILAGTKGSDRQKIISQLKQKYALKSLGEPKRFTNYQIDKKKYIYIKKII